MKKILFFVFIVILVSCFTFSCFAGSYSAYSSVTDSNSQVQQLLTYYLQDASPLDEFIIIRIGEYDYRLFYARDLIEDQYVNFIDYSRYNIGQYNYEYRYSTGVENNFSFNLGIYTAVGNISGEKILYSETFDRYQTRFFLKVIGIAFFVVFVFSVFRIHIGKRREVRL